MMFKSETISTVYVNGIYLTPAAIAAIDYLQTGGTIDNGYHDRAFTNIGIKQLKADIDELNSIIIEELSSGTISEAKCTLILRKLNGIAYYLFELTGPLIKINE